VAAPSTVSESHSNTETDFIPTCESRSTGLLFCARLALLLKELMGEAPYSEHDKMLRAEIIESEKTQADFLKWKLIAVAAVASISLGFAGTTNPTVPGARLLLCLVPLICAYVDLMSLHIMIRIITIGLYLKISGNSYEEFVFAVRERGAANPFVLEGFALHGSSIVFNIIVIVLGFTLPQPAGIEPSKALAAYVLSGGLGVVTTVFLWFWYNNRTREVGRLAEATIKRGPQGDSPCTGHLKS